MEAVFRYRLRAVYDVRTSSLSADTRVSVNSNALRILFIR